MDRQMDRQDIQEMIDAAVSAAYTRGAWIQGVLQNHAFGLIPSATTALTTAAAVVMGTVSLVAKGSGNIRVQFYGSIIALNSLQAIITPSVTVTQNGINTFSAGPPGTGNNVALPIWALPGNTSNPSVAPIVGYFETASVKNTVGFTGAAGQTIAVTLLIGASTTGGSVAAGAIGMEVSEAF